MLSDYFNATIIRIRETKNEFNEVLSIDEIRIPGRVERSTKTIISKAGKETLTSFLFLFNSDCDLLDTDKIKYLNKSYEILSISHETEFTESHKEVYI